MVISEAVEDSILQNATISQRINPCDALTPPSVMMLRMIPIWTSPSRPKSGFRSDMFLNCLSLLVFVNGGYLATR